MNPFKSSQSYSMFIKMLQILAIAAAFVLLLWKLCILDAHVDLCDVHTPSMDALEREAEDKQSQDAVNRVDTENERPGDRERSYERFSEQGV